MSEDAFEHPAEFALGGGLPGGIHQDAFRYAVALPLARFALIAYRVFDAEPAPARRRLSALLDALDPSAGVTYASFEADIDVMLLALPEALVVVFPGTKSRENWGVNLAVDLVPVDGYGGEVRVHAGFKRAWDMARPTIVRFLTEELARAPRKIYVTGHSLGGAIATIASADLSSLADGGIGAHVAACYTFGAPKVGTRAFDSFVRAPLYRVTQGVDVVPALPLGISVPLLRTLLVYRQGGDTRWFPPEASGRILPDRRAPGFLRGLSAAFAATLVRVWWTGRLDVIADHGMERYVRRLRAAKSFIDARRRGNGAP